MTGIPQRGRLKLDGRKIDELISYGMRRFADAEIYVSPSKMSKLVRGSAQRHGYAWAKHTVDSYFEFRELISWESYALALGGKAIYS